MAVFRVVGNDRDSGLATSFTVDVLDEDAALEEAALRGVLVSEVMPLRGLASKKASGSGGLATPTWRVCVLILLLGQILVTWRLAVSPDWQYRIESPNDRDFIGEMNEFGRDGWEIVTARRATGINDNAQYEVILKRRR